MTGSKVVLDDKATSALVRLVDAVRHPGQLMSNFAAIMLTSTQRRFERQVGPDNVAWKPLSKRTAQRKVNGRRRGTKSILRLSTRLYQSLITASDERSAEVGTNVEYAGIHQFGGTIEHFARSQTMSLKKIRKRTRFVPHGTKGAELRRVTIGEHGVTIPARPYLGFSEQDIAALNAEGVEYLRKELAE